MDPHDSRRAPSFIACHRVWQNGLLARAERDPSVLEGVRVFVMKQGVDWAEGFASSLLYIRLYFDLALQEGGLFFMQNWRFYERPDDAAAPLAPAFNWEWDAHKHLFPEAYAELVDIAGIWEMSGEQRAALEEGLCKKVLVFGNCELPERDDLRPFEARRRAASPQDFERNNVESLRALATPSASLAREMHGLMPKGAPCLGWHVRTGMMPDMAEARAFVSCALERRPVNPPSPTRPLLPAGSFRAACSSRLHKLYRAHAACRPRVWQLCTHTVRTARALTHRACVCRPRSAPRQPRGGRGAGGAAAVPGVRPAGGARPGAGCTRGARFGVSDLPCNVRREGG